MSEAPNDLGRFLRHSSVYVFGNVINRVGAFILLPLYTNYLTLAEYGRLELFYSVFAVVTGLVGAGFAHATLRFYFEYDDIQERNQVVITNLVTSLLVSLAGVTLVGLFADPIVVLLFDDRGLAVALYIGLLTVILEISSQICLAYVRAVEKSLLFVLLAGLKLIIQVVANTAFLVWYDAGVTGVLSGNLLAVMAGWLILVIFVLKNCGLRWNFTQLRDVLAYSYPFIFGSLVGVVRTNADKFLLNSLLGPEALGLYALAFKFGQILETLVGQPFQTAYGAFRFSVMKQDNAPHMQADIFRLLMAVCFTFGLGLAFYTIDVLRLMSDPGFHPAAQLLPLLVLAFISHVATYVLQSGILIAKKTVYLMHISVLSAVVSIAANFALISLFGVQGACLALLITGLISAAANEWVSRRYFPVAYPYAKLLMLLVLSGASYLFYLAIQQNGDQQLPLKSLVFAIYLYLLFKTGIFRKEEIEQGKGFLKKPFL